MAQVNAIDSRSERCIQLLYQHQALRFGEFVTKSSRFSPYFFDTSVLYRGESWQKFVQLFLEVAIAHWKPDQVLSILGAAYKGAPLAVTLAQLWSDYSHVSLHFSVLRKEIKDHGEGGRIMGNIPKNTSDSGLARGVIIVDDVLTSGKSLRECARYLLSQKIPLIGVLVGIDRQERDEHHVHFSAKQAIEEEFSVPVCSILSIQDMLHQLPSALRQEKSICQSIESYLDRYGVLYTA